MPALTRRCYPERRHVNYGDVQVGTIAKRTGAPHNGDPWEWLCGFYPGCGPGDHTNGTAATFDEACAAFEEAWQALLPQRTEADFQEWRCKDVTRPLDSCRQTAALRTKGDARFERP
jgi:hypothetical protein